MDTGRKKTKQQKVLGWKQHATLGVSVINRNDYADYDYLQKLNVDELHWLKGFHREFVNADFKHKHKKIFLRPEERRMVYGLNNSRNRDTYNVCKWTGLLLLKEKMDKSDIQPVWYEYYRGT